MNINKFHSSINTMVPNKIVCTKSHEICYTYIRKHESTVATQY